MKIIKTNKSIEYIGIGNRIWQGHSGDICGILLRCISYDLTELTATTSLSIDPFTFMM